jgi:hypothetical protein
MAKDTFLTPRLIITPSDQARALVLQTITDVSGVTLSETSPQIQWHSAEDSGYAIENVRDLLQDLGLQGFSPGLRVYALIDIDAASPVAQNTLLKSLEEPPAQTLLVLTASQLSRIVPTIQSRCVIVKPKVMEGEEVEKTRTVDTGSDSETPIAADLYQQLTTSNPGQIVSWVEGYSDAASALTMVASLSTYLQTQQATPTTQKHRSALLQAYQDLLANVNVKLVLENLGFQLGKS